MYNYQQHNNKILQLLKDKNSLILYENDIVNWKSKIDNFIGINSNINIPHLCCSNKTNIITENLFKYKSEFDISIIGLKRSGINSLISFTASHFNDNSVYSYQDIPKHGLTETVFYNRECLLNKKCNKFFVNEEMYNLDIDINKECIIHTYEDFDFIKNDLHDFGMSLHPKIILIIIRNPLNIIASRLKRTEKNEYYKKYNYFNEIIDLWKIYCDEIIGNTNILKLKKYNVKGVIYEKYISDIEYRKKISEYFYLPNVEHSFIDTIEVGGVNSKSSSFADNNFNNRWKEYKDHEIIVKIKNDQYIQNLWNILLDKY